MFVFQRRQSPGTVSPSARTRRSPLTSPRSKSGSIPGSSEEEKEREKDAGWAKKVGSPKIERGSASKVVFGSRSRGSSPTVSSRKEERNSLGQMEVDLDDENIDDIGVPSATPKRGLLLQIKLFVFNFSVLFLKLRLVRIDPIVGVIKSYVALWNVMMMT